MIYTADQKTRWTQLCGAAWNYAAAGEISTAIELYRQASEDLPGEINPQLSVLRHSIGEAEGRVTAAPPNEMDIISFQIADANPESADAFGMNKVVIDPDVIGQSIRTILRDFDPGHFGVNIRKSLPHVMVLSPGRSGTVSLYRLFERSRLMSHHSYWWHVSPSTRFEMLCRVLSGRVDDQSSMRIWCETRAAEWIGAVNHDRPMIGLNHTDTIFAPVFAALHSKSKFVYLKRNRADVIASFFNKLQWGENSTQLQPLLCSFNPVFRWRRPGHDIPACLAWYLHFTEMFSRIFGEILGDRFIEISADKLFAQDRDEVARLIEFTGSGLYLDEAVDHFAVKINQKAAKVALMPLQSDAAMEAHDEALARIIETGKL